MWPIVPTLTWGLVAHHAAYVKGANDTLEQLAEARDKDQINPTSLVGLEKTFAFNLSGHVLHSIFWKNLAPDSADRPDGDLDAAIVEHFGGFEPFAGQLHGRDQGPCRAPAGACSRGSRSASG